jgi:DNA repair exonuclease SbcCD ATPase subunit
MQGMAERLHDSNGVLNDDRIRNTIIENHRRTTATITATTMQLQKQQQALDTMQTKIIQALSAQSKAIESDQQSLQQAQKSLATIQKQFHELERSTASYTEQINGKVREMSQITANNEEVLERISTIQHSVSSEVAKAQQNLLETSEILKKISSR